MENKKRAWVYCRIDAPEDTHGALKGQRQQLMDYAEQMGFTVAGSSEDLASGNKFDYPGLNRVIEAAQAGKMDVLIVHDVSRIGGDTCLAMECLERLCQMGVQTYSPLEGVLDFTFQRVIRDAAGSAGFQPKP